MPKEHKPPRLRVQRILAKLPKQPGWDFDDLEDPRQAKKCSHKLSSIIWAAELGLIANQPTLRDVEQMTEELGPVAKALVPTPISDTTLHAELQRLDETGLQRKLVEQVRATHRSKQLKPFGVPYGIATIDGKNLATLSHDADKSGHKRSKVNDKWAPKAEEIVAGMPYWLMPVVRVVLTSAEAKPCIHQQVLEPGQGESAEVASAIMDALVSAYGRSGLFEVVQCDAGFTSLSLADDIDRRGYAYIMGLKDNQPTLMEWAERVLRGEVDRGKPEAQTVWERRNGKWIRRKLYRTSQLQGFPTSAGKWQHLRQVWLVRQETRDENGTVEVEDRYFLSSLLWTRFKPQHILNAVRGEWGIENDAFNSLDLQWREDSAPWCTQGRATWILGLLRVMAYNVVQLLRKRTLRPKAPEAAKRPDPPRWRAVFGWLRTVLTARAVDVAYGLSPD